MRALSEIRTLCFRLRPFGVSMKESYYIDMDWDKSVGWDFFIILDDGDLEYRRSVGETR